MKDYDAALDLELDSMEKFVLQCLAFYQVNKYMPDFRPSSWFNVMPLLSIVFFCVALFSFCFLSFGIF